ncbi:DgyrCDS2165 [Dimorphilus gyrociliatus]|uniref:DgyrCDS2165 n=1 Tax=Dimorphilus gyrociliatus TaxID=2664684 RepID=A0A7I8V9M3_9ANNE|nr:DgyrCDS2165 [Dimorphilus gyrociliatus]
MQDISVRRPLPQLRRQIQIEPEVIVPKPVINKRSRAYICSLTQLTISIMGFAIGLAAYTTTDNIRAGSFWPHIAMGLATILFIVGLSSYPKGKAWLIGGLVLNALGLIMAFIGGIVDGVEAGHVATTDFNQCAYALQGGTTFCQQTQLISSCKLTIKADTCFCCYVHRKQKCEKTVSLATQSSEYQGVKSCGEIEGRFQSLLWASMILCIINFMIGIASMILISYYKSSLQVRK